MSLLVDSPVPAHGTLPNANLISRTDSSVLSCTPPSTSASAAGSESPAPPVVIAGLTVHPAALLFPEMSPRDFDDLVASIEQFGQHEPVVVDGDVLLEGRHRAQAVEVLKVRGVDIELRTKPWQPQKAQTRSEYIYAVNACRRQLKDDQRAIIFASMAPVISVERAAIQEQSRIKPGEVRNPNGRNGRAELVATNAAPPSSPNARDKDARSTAGKIAAAAGTSRHKAQQAQKALKTASPEDIAAVASGAKKLKDIVPGKPAKRPADSSKPGEIRVVSLWTAKGGSGAQSEFHAKVAKDWERLKAKYAVTEYPELRSSLKAILTDEEKAVRK
jgi:hypothetical protein